MQNATKPTRGTLGSVRVISSSCRSVSGGYLRCYGATSEDLASKTILEVGCGTGQWLRDFIKWGARPENITGIDLLADRVSKARRLCPPSVRIECASAAELPFADGTFDLVLQSTVFTSILAPDLKRRVAAEMMRVVKPEGFILWYDYHVNNPWNSDVRGVKRREIAQSIPRLSDRAPANHIAASFSPFLGPVFLLGLLPFGETIAALYSLFRRDSQRIISLILQASVWLTAELCVSVVINTALVAA